MPAANDPGQTVRLGRLGQHLPEGVLDCSLHATCQPFADVTLRALSPNHGTYGSQVAHVTQRNLEAGFIVWGDAEDTIREAAQSGTGRRQR